MKKENFLKRFRAIIDESGKIDYPISKVKFLPKSEKQLDIFLSEYNSAKLNRNTEEWTQIDFDWSIAKAYFEYAKKGEDLPSVFTKNDRFEYTPQY
jgi:hypothetical protein